MMYVDENGSTLSMAREKKKDINTLTVIKDEDTTIINKCDLLDDNVIQQRKSIISLIESRRKSDNIPIC